ncbi:unnamed protein product [Trichogramma brassicae]|uniref:Uncharacterized protein n=1 Tax=Trichogramma brassicae TaxID=86971 RepID=A0A6H5IK03_9HYME|nr:unnamed protein product [Trichogramma brassicae]
MGFFSNHGMIERSNLEAPDDWRDDEDFVRAARACTIRTNLTLDDAIRLSVDEAASRLEPRDYHELAGRWNIPDRHGDACVRHLCEKALRPFFRRWTLYPFWALIHHRLPVENCELVLESLANEDFYNIVVAQHIDAT